MKKPQHVVNRRLLVWALPRLLWSLTILAIAILIPIAVHHEARMWSPAMATVVRSQFSAPGHHLEVAVNLVSPTDHVRVTAGIEPRSQKVMRPGQHIPVLYYRSSDNVVLYAGLGGDIRQQNYDSYYILAIFLIALAVIPLATGVSRCHQVLAAGTAPIKTQLQVEEINGGRWTRRIRANNACGGMDLEWQVLRWQPKVSGMVAVGGCVKGGRWLVIELMSEKKFIWPSSRTQPVIGTGMQEVMPSGANFSPLINAHRRLLSAYVQIIDDIDLLPFMIRRSPGLQAKTNWWGWWFGAPRFVVRGLVVAHVRRHLRILGNGLTRASMVNGVIDGGTGRTDLSAASDECRALAATLPRSTWRAVMAFLITVALPVGLTIYTAFIKPSPIHIKLAVPPDISLLLAIAVTLAVPFTFNRSLWCKKVIFCPALGLQNFPNVLAPSSASWNVYKFEREAFLRVGLISPPEWEARTWVTALVIETYILAIFMPILFISSVISIVIFFLVTIVVSTAVAAAFASNTVDSNTQGISGKKHRSSIPLIRLSATQCSGGVITSE